MRFVKAHGAGNDFVLLPDLEGRIELTAPLVRALCRPHFGLGADGVIRVAAPGPGKVADVFMDYWNADGSVAQMCGNGVRCVAKHVVDHGLVTGQPRQGDRGDAVTVRVDTRAGVKPVVCLRGPDGRVERVCVDMGAPVPIALDHPIDVDGGRLRLTTLSLGNPHAVLVVENVATAPVTALGPLIEHHPAFPEGTNVEFIAAPARRRVVGRIWERGVGETMASGTGASAMAAAAVLLGLADRRVEVELPGGVLEIDWRNDILYASGPAVEVASGHLDDAWLAALEKA
jgi:diaminopimelate epimerase